MTNPYPWYCRESGEVVPLGAANYGYSATGRLIVPFGGRPRWFGYVRGEDSDQVVAAIWRDHITRFCTSQRFTVPLIFYDYGVAPTEPITRVSSACSAKPLNPTRQGSSWWIWTTRPRPPSR